MAAAASSTLSVSGRRRDGGVVARMKAGDPRRKKVVARNVSIAEWNTSRNKKLLLKAALQFLLQAMDWALQAIFCFDRAATARSRATHAFSLIFKNICFPLKEETVPVFEIFQKY
jgi:hypothetical protein